MTFDDKLNEALKDCGKSADQVLDEFFRYIIGASGIITEGMTPGRMIMEAITSRDITSKVTEYIKNAVSMDPKKGKPISIQDIKAIIFKMYKEEFPTLSDRDIVVQNGQEINGAALHVMNWLSNLARYGAPTGRGTLSTGESPNIVYMDLNTIRRMLAGE